ncbi:NAD(P)H-hydrate dehydratase [Rhodobacter sp. SY28-1]|uniref:NAD(P)H-hydrate dehydratase n=1 Tax=Rhodobacter sp. SY28-1 TaxID=2562317 RepID=UPI0010C14DB8|nr:NAD(P)H-hydrate dehydratase [Rhodobacter sp. SY28-1]
MTELLTAAQMRAIEAAAIASGEVTGLELMKRAGRGVVEAIFEEWPELRATSHRAVVLCGPGNNGGDGFVVARLLKEWGWEVEVFLYGDPEKMPPDARVNYERWRGMGEVVAFNDKATAHLVEREPPSLVVDAFFGTGLTRDIGRIVRETSEALWMHVSIHRGRIVAIDIPSGICADSGKDLGRALPATLTVSFHKKKLGHLIGEGPVHSFRTVIADIGLPDRSERGRVSLTNADETFLRKSRQPQHHKYSHGHALIVSGTSGRGGAARLAARGALRIGAGVVTVGCPLDAIPEHAARLDAVMLRGVADGLGLEETLEDGRINALCVGPGLGLDARGREVVAVVLESRGRPRPTVGRGLPRRSVVLDADALTILSQNPDLFAALHGACVLTPHAGEFARLFPDIAEKLAAPATKGPAYSKVDATREAAKRAGCVVLFKGPDTVIADPTGRCAINSAHYDRAAPWLATAGSGDVLAGFITGLLARGFSPFDAACTGAWLHVECALSFGPGLIAEDLPEELPKVFRVLGV